VCSSRRHPSAAQGAACPSGQVSSGATHPSRRDDLETVLAAFDAGVDESGNLQSEVFSRSAAENRVPLMSQSRTRCR
jgi:hypothetical protein